MRAELGGGVADRGQRAQHQQFALGQGEPGSGVEVAEAELGQEPGERGVERFGQVGQVVLISLPYSGACTARPLVYRSASVTVPWSGRGSGMSLAWKTSLIVATAFRVGGKPMNGASWYGLSNRDGPDADVERGPGVRAQLRQGLQARQQGDGYELPGLVV